MGVKNFTELGLVGKLSDSKIKMIERGKTDT